MHACWFAKMSKSFAPIIIIIIIICIQIWISSWWEVNFVNF